MKRNQVDAILVDQAKRKNKIISYISLIVILTILSLAFIILYIDNKKVHYIKYSEDSKLDYNVFLKNNDFFPSNQLKSNNQYIASLIDYIEANFDYKLELKEEDINYKYSYRIEADVNVKDKESKKSLYRYKEDLLKEVMDYSNNSSDVKISEEVKIDYNRYNELIKKFISVYDLDEVESTLNINMYVKVLGECETLEKVDKNSVISLSIPLTTKTMAIDIGYDLVKPADENILACKNNNHNAIFFIIVSIIVSTIDVYLIIKLVKYIIVTRTAESIYERELKKILNNYKSYIQKVNSVFNFEGYQIMKVDTFNDMLEIRDTIQEPILMIENKEKSGVYFLIPSKTNIIYLYGLKVSEIKKQMTEIKEI